MNRRPLLHRHSAPVRPSRALVVRERRRMAVTSSWSRLAAARLAYISRTSMLTLRGSGGFLRQQREELAPQVRILQERAAHHAVGHRRIQVLDAAPLHAEVVGLH